MGAFLNFNSRFPSLASDWNILSIVQLQIIHSQSGECTRVPWESLKLMVIYLTLVNNIHQWMIIKWFLSYSTSGHLFGWIELYYLGLEWRTWMVRYSLENGPIFRFQWIIFWVIAWIHIVCLVVILKFGSIWHRYTMYIP